MYILSYVLAPLPARHCIQALEIIHSYQDIHF